MMKVTGVMQKLPFSGRVFRNAALPAADSLSRRVWPMRSLNSRCCGNPVGPRPSGPEFDPRV